MLLKYHSLMFYKLGNIHFIACLDSIEESNYNVFTFNPIIHNFECFMIYMPLTTLDNSITKLTFIIVE